MSATLAARFTAIAHARPDVTAVRRGDVSLTYADLNCRANRIAHALVALGVGPERVVAVRELPPLNMPALLLGVAKAGGVYLPLDPTYPADRLDYMVDDSGALLLDSTP